MNKILQLRFTLKLVHPPIWRVVRVPFDFRLDQLGILIPLTIDWNPDPGHEFHLRGPSHSNAEDEAAVTIGELMPKAPVKLTYIHNLRFNWTIGVTVQKILPPDPEETYPLCVSGKYSAPLDNRGGPLTFTPVEEILEDPEHEDYEETLATVGEDFDPEFFDLAKVNKEIQAHNWE